MSIELIKNFSGYVFLERLKRRKSTLCSKFDLGRGGGFDDLPWLCITFLTPNLADFSVALTNKSYFDSYEPNFYNSIT